MGSNTNVRATLMREAVGITCFAITGVASVAMLFAGLLLL